MLLTFLFTFFVDSLSNPLFIVTICVPKRWVKMIWVDNQIIMRFVLELEGVENEESLWKLADIHRHKERGPILRVAYPFA